MRTQKEEEMLQEPIKKRGVVIPFPPDSHTLRHQVVAFRTAASFTLQVLLENLKLLHSGLWELVLAHTYLGYPNADVVEDE